MKTLKTMKKIILSLLIAVFAIVSCTKEKEVSRLSKKMNYTELSKNVGSKIAFEIFDRSGKTEVIIPDGDWSARVAKKVKANATVEVIFDLSLSVSGGAIVYSTNPDADFAGVTKFVSTTSNDGALGIWDCNRYWSPTQTPDPTVNCSDSATTGYFLRAFTSNSTTGTVRLSEWVAG